MEISIEDIDKNGVILGRLFSSPDVDLASSSLTSSNSKKRLSYSNTLLAAGLARIDKYAIERGTIDQETLLTLQELQQNAKTAKLGIWSLESNLAEDAEVGDAEEGAEESDPTTSNGDGHAKWALGNLVEVTVSEIVDGTTFFVHEKSKETALAAFTQELGQCFTLFYTLFYP